MSDSPIADAIMKEMHAKYRASGVHPGSYTLDHERFEGLLRELGQKADLRGKNTLVVHLAFGPMAILRTPPLREPKPIVLGEMWFEDKDGIRRKYLVAEPGLFERIERLLDAAREMCRHTEKGQQPTAPPHLVWHALNDALKEFGG